MVKGGAAAMATAHIVVSHYNDPALVIPATPAA
jgi:hypothetical protein